MSTGLEHQQAELARRMGRHLRDGRRQRFPRDTQGDFARRIGVSRYTYQKMEHGDSGVALRSYLTAAILLGVDHAFTDGLTPPPRPFFDDNG